MLGDRQPAQVTALRLISQVDKALRDSLSLLAGEHAVGLIACDSDDVGYTALDEATKKAHVRVCYATSMYAGARNANTLLAGEFIGMLAGPDPAEVISGLNAARQMIEEGACFYSANADDSIVYFAHVISRSGSYLSSQNGLPEGAPLAYLIAPPLESVYALDRALKAADVTLAAFYGPPSPTNFGGALLTGSQAACRAACEAFADAVCDVAQRPLFLG